LNEHINLVNVHGPNDDDPISIDNLPSKWQGILIGPPLDRSSG
jgi:hypothetical protein